ncbi:hypothetical protein HDV04_000080 [Boothiomyces sp. JEL0838]|nr:hypothetical protein HDV04_000080 [Boothiomyces sp. JEL0838]
MTTKDELQFWVEANDAYKLGNLQDALELFRNVGPYSKILFNIGMIYSRIDDHESSNIMFTQCLQLDQFCAVAYVQKGYACFMLYEYEQAEACFKKALELLLENDFIDYEQLGLKFKLYRCEVLYNIAMCCEQLNDNNGASRYIQEASKHMKTDDHRSVIGSSRRNDNVTLFTVPFSCIFSLSDQKIKNLKKKEFLGEAKLVIDSDGGGPDGPGFIGFTGATAVLDIEVNATTTLARKKTVKEEPKSLLKAASSPLLGKSDYKQPATIGRSQTETKRTPNPPVSRSQTAPRAPPKDSNPRSRDERPRSPPKSREPTETKKIYSRKSSLPTSRAPKVEPDPMPRSKTLGRSRGSGSDSGYEEAGTIRVKIHTDKSTISMNVSQNIKFDQFLDDVCDKMNRNDAPQLCFPDEDDPDTMITVVDDDDFFMVMSTSSKIKHFYIAKEGAKDNDVLDFY